MPNALPTSQPSVRWRFYTVQIVTLARVPLTIVLAVLLTLFFRAPGQPWVLWTCAGLLLVAELTDLIDGWLARYWRVVSESGAALDPYCDSVSRLIVYWTLAEVQLALAAVPLVMAVRDVTVAYCRIQWTRAGKSVAAKWSGKVKAVVQGVAAFGLLLAPLSMQDVQLTKTTLSWIVIAVTAYSGVDYFTQGWRTEEPAK